MKDKDNLRQVEEKIGKISEEKRGRKRQLKEKRNHGHQRLTRRRLSSRKSQNIHRALFTPEITSYYLTRRRVLSVRSYTLEQLCETWKFVI